MNIEWIRLNLLVMTMAIAFYFKGGDLVIVYDLSENKKKKNMFTCGFDMIFPM